MTAQNSHRTIKSELQNFMFQVIAMKDDDTGTEQLDDALHSIEEIIKRDVIGEDEVLLPWNGDTPEVFEANTRILKINRHRAEQRTALTKALYGKERE